MRRHHPALVALALALSAAAGCTPRAADKAADGAADKARPLVTATRPPAHDPSSPFRNPSREPPPPRAGAQLDDAALDAALRDAEALAATDGLAAATVLRACANRIPQSARCEGRLGLLLVEHPAYLAEARYYLAEVAAADDPALDAAFYAAIAAALQGQALHEEAVQALQKALARDGANAERHARLAAALQGIGGRERDAAAALHRAFELDPTQLAWLYDEAVLLSQIADEKPRAIALLRDYLTRLQGADPAVTARIEGRIAELELDIALSQPAEPSKSTKKPQGAPPLGGPR